MLPFLRGGGLILGAGGAGEGHWFASEETVNNGVQNTFTRLLLIWLVSYSPSVTISLSLSLSPIYPSPPVHSILHPNSNHSSYHPHNHLLPPIPPYHPSLPHTAPHVSESTQSTALTPFIINSHNEPILQPGHFPPPTKKQVQSLSNII